MIWSGPRTCTSNVSKIVTNVAALFNGDQTRPGQRQEVVALETHLPCLAFVSLTTMTTTTINVQLL